MMKIIGIVMIVTSCSLAGMGISLKYKRRVESLEFYIRFIRMYQEQVRWRQLSILEALETLSKSRSITKTDYIKHVYELYKQSADFQYALLTPIKDSDISLEKPDEQILSEFAQAIGKNDMAGELHLCDECISRLDECRLKAAEIYKKNGSLALKIGILIGVWIGIILI